MTDGLYGIVGRVDYGEEGCQDPEENARAHQRYRGDVQLVHQEGSLPEIVYVVNISSHN